MLLISETLNKIFEVCEAINASDVHISYDEIPRFRITGNLMPNPIFNNFNPETVDAIAMELGLQTLPIGCADGTERIRLTLLKEGSVDGAISSPSGTRYRFNIFRENSRTAIAMRKLDSTFHSLSTLGLPEKIEEFCKYPDGLVIVTGPTGSGKSTTLATLINIINNTSHRHIVTIEDPIEFIHTSRKSLVHQRQIGRDAKDFSSALVESLRQDPDVILVGEIRDLATFRTALTASETGHLVFATLHAGDCVGAIERFISVFPSDEQNGIRQQLALSLRGVIAQHLLPSIKGKRTAVCELMINTVATANLIATARTAQLLSIIETSGNIGMQSMDQSLAMLIRQNKISEAAAYTLSKSPETLRSRLATSGV